MRRKCFQWLSLAGIALGSVCWWWLMPSASPSAASENAHVPGTTPPPPQRNVLPPTPGLHLADAYDASVTTPTGELRRTLFPAPQQSLDTLRRTLEASDVHLLGWHPQGGYDVLLSVTTLDALTAQGIRAEVSPLPMTPRLRRALEQETQVEATMVFSTRLRAREIATQYGGQAVGDAVRVQLPTTEAYALIASSADLLASDLTIHGELFTHATRADRFLGADTLQLNNTWLRGEGEVVGVFDTGCSSGTAEWSSAHPGLKSRLLRLSPQPWQDTIGTAKDNNGHGTHVAGCIVGDGSGSTNNRFRGVASGARLFFQNASEGSNDFKAPYTMDTVYDEVYRAGGRIHSNSWGEGGSVTSYTSAPTYSLFSWANDRYVWQHQDFLPLFAAGNEGTDLDKDGVVDLRSMGSSTTTAKNILVVGAAESYQWKGITADGVSPATYANFSLYSGSAVHTRLKTDPTAAGANGADVRGLALFSCTGPLPDGRIKPDIVTPGTQIVSTLRQGKTRNLSISYGASSDERQHYCAMSGTSMATPLTAGACAVIRQYCREVLKMEAPSSPVVRALLISGAQSMYPGQFGDGADREIYSAAPNGREGFGLTSLTRSLTPEKGRPEVEAFTYTAETALAWTINVSEAAPFRATLVWNDYPAPVYTQQALVNDLDLMLTTADGEVVAYANGLSAPDRCNVIERIDVELTPGTYTLHVDARRVPFPGGEAALVLLAPDTAATPTLAHTPLSVVAPNVATPLEAKLLWQASANDTITLEVRNEEGHWVKQSSLTLPAQAEGTTQVYRLTAPGATTLGPYTAHVGTAIPLTIATTSETWVLATPSLYETLDVVPGQEVTCSAQDTEVFTYDTNVGTALYRISGWSLSDGTNVLASGTGTRADFTVPTGVSALTLTWTTAAAETAVDSFVYIYLDGTPFYVPYGGTFTFPEPYASHGYWREKWSSTKHYTAGDQLSPITASQHFVSDYTVRTVSVDTDGDGYSDNEEALDGTDYQDAASVPEPPRLTLLEDPPARTPVADTSAHHLAFQASDNASVTRIEVRSRRKGAATWTTTAFSSPNRATVTPLGYETEYQIVIADGLGWNGTAFSTTRPNHILSSPIYILKSTSFAPGYLWRVR